MKSESEHADMGFASFFRGGDGTKVKHIKTSTEITPKKLSKAEQWKRNLEKSAGDLQYVEKSDVLIRRVIREMDRITAQGIRSLTFRFYRVANVLTWSDIKVHNIGLKDLDCATENQSRYYFHWLYDHASNRKIFENKFEDATGIRIKMSTSICNLFKTNVDGSLTPEIYSKDVPCIEWQVNVTD